MTVRLILILIIIGMGLWLITLVAHAAPPLLPVGGYAVKVCEVEAITARQFAEARDAGTPEAMVHERLDRVAATHPELALTDGDIRREHAVVSEIWALGHLTPDSIFGFTLHRCLHGRVES